jgi:hypothetical protein
MEQTKAENHDAIRALQDAVSVLFDSACKVEDAWMKCGEDTEEGLTDIYPDSFSESFDEVRAGIGEWIWAIRALGDTFTE